MPFLRALAENESQLGFELRLPIPFPMTICEAYLLIIIIIIGYVQ